MASPITVSQVMSGWPNVLRWSKIWKQPAISSIEYAVMTRTLSGAWQPSFRSLTVTSSSLISRPLDWQLPVPQEYRQF